MNANDCIDCLMNEIDLFECTYNKYPEMIVMSSALASHIGNGMGVYIELGCRQYDGTIGGSIAGIPLTICPSSEPKCYLVEKIIHMY